MDSGGFSVCGRRYMLMRSGGRRADWCLFVVGYFFAVEMVSYALLKLGFVFVYAYVPQKNIL